MAFTTSPTVAWAVYVSKIESAIYKNNGEKIVLTHRCHMTKDLGAIDTDPVKGRMGEPISV